MVSVLLAGCVTNGGEWTKPGASLDDFNRDKYGCLQQSQQPSSSLYVNRYGGYGNSGVITNGGLYGACMNARGWALMSISDTRAFNAEVAAAGASIRQACFSEDYSALFSRKMACKPTETTENQMEDRSKISSTEKDQLAKWLALVVDNNAKVASLQRKYNPKSGEVLASDIESGTAEVQANVAQLSAGKITWGDFNKKRLNLAKRMNEAAHVAILTN